MFSGDYLEMSDFSLRLDEASVDYFGTDEKIDLWVHWKFKFFKKQSSIYLTSSVVWSVS